MKRIFTDFQAAEADEACFILVCDGAKLDHAVAEAVGLRIGDRVILDAHEDFEVIGTLDFRFVKALGRESWVAHPDWSTRIEKQS